MMQEIKLVQGFRGSIKYTLDSDVSKAVVRLNFTDRYEQNKKSVLCRQGDSPNEVVIPFNRETTEAGDFFGEFVVQTVFGVDIYPVEGHIPIKIRKRI